MQPWRWPLRWQALGLLTILIAAAGTSIALGHRTWLMPGETSDGHHVIEEACNRCHGGFARPSNDGCTGCHRRELSNDTHPVETFDDPRWAADRAQLDARYCVSCHAEHARNERTLSVTNELCFRCHDDVIGKRESHKRFGRGSCMNGGCHNYHDNGTLELAFLKKRLREPAAHERPLPLSLGNPHSLVATREVPRGVQGHRDKTIAWRWEHSAHGKQRIGCERCHGAKSEYVERPNERACAQCHGFEVDSFLHGKHGARRAAGLPPLRVEQARLPMRADASHKELGCGACHDPHALDIQHAATNACLGCHDDAHSRAHERSPHAAAGVTCATCHMPRMEVGASGGARRVAVLHNNSFTRQPRDRMASMVCGNCHGMELALSALFDDACVDDAFMHRPAQIHPTIEMVSTAN